jgi:hypothetical protein
MQEAMLKKEMLLINTEEFPQPHPSGNEDEEKQAFLQLLVAP